MRRSLVRGIAVAATAVVTMGVGVAAADAGTGYQPAIGIPAYWSPEVESGMAMFDRLAEATPTVDTVIINGPASAPPVPFSAATAEAIRRLRREGATVLGYVDTGYLGRTGLTTTRVAPGSTEIADWRAQIDADAKAWQRLYGRYGLAGIFLDQTLSSCGVDGEYVDVYGAVGRQIQRRQRGATIALNPGTTVDECYTDVADVIMIFENTAEVYQTWEPPAWVREHPETMFWHLIHGAATIDDMRAALALARDRHAGYVYVTNHTISAAGSPWTDLPPAEYWEDQLRQVRRRCR
ncbi:MAG TPA: spherulation-specific family 4 protein [Pilimelia sp.]|nr:spherulation-specific family 4 protein [Pilimelia sp.]